MFYRLKTTNGAVELFALFRVRHRLIQHVLCGAQCVCSNCNSANIQHALEYADIGAYTLGSDIVVGQLDGATRLINSGQMFASKAWILSSNQVQVFVLIRHQVGVGDGVEGKQGFAK